MTYDELISNLQDWVESTEISLVANLDDMIEFAEKRIYRSLDLNSARKETTLSLTQGTGTITLPSDAVVVRSVSYKVTSTGSLIYLQSKDITFIDAFTGTRSVEGVPRYYAHLDDSTLLIGPTPNAIAATLEVAHTYRPTQLSSTNTTTWLSLEAPEVLLYACLKEIATYQLQEQDIIANYDKMYQEAFKGTLLEENFRNRTDEARIGEIRVGQ